MTATYGGKYSGNEIKLFGLFLQCFETFLQNVLSVSFQNHKRFQLLQSLVDSNNKRLHIYIFNIGLLFCKLLLKFIFCIYDIVNDFRHYNDKTKGEQLFLFS